MCNAFNRLVLAIALIAAGAASAYATQVTGSLTVNGYHAYGDFGGGDVIFYATPTLPGCSGGGWISPSQAGAKTMIATIMTAKLSGTQISVNMDNALLWNGTSTPYCKVYSIGLQ